MELKDQISRIEKMEHYYDALAAQIEVTRKEINRLAELLPALQELEIYYENGEWLEDYDADRQGLIPRDLKRGILCEDTIYNLLIDKTEFMHEMAELLENFPPSFLPVQS